MDEYYQLTSKIIKKTNKLEGLHNLHYTSIAKAIENHFKERMKIIFRGEPKDKKKLKKLNLCISGTTISQDILVEVPLNNGSKRFIEHYIYYPTKVESLKKRFIIAHELGHIFLHHSKMFTKPRYLKVGESDTTHFYVVDFTQKEEAEADVFAAILTEQRISPQRSEQYVLPCIRKMARLKKQKLLCKKVCDLLPPSVTCVKKGSIVKHCFDRC